MKNLPNSRFERLQPLKQRGVVLFMTLVALLAMSLAAVALIRSVDTSTMIAGNLANKQSALAAANRTVEVANLWLATMKANNNTINILVDPTLLHPFNKNAPALGYYSGLDPNLNLVDHTAASHLTWTDADSQLVPDPYGNEVRYVIQRICRAANMDIKHAKCLFSAPAPNTGSQAVRYPEDVCSGDGCPLPGQTPQIRITVKTTGPRYTVSYVQAFVN
jgi:Tfp pilus assembly protein PilX